MIECAIRLSLGSDGAITYTEALDMNVWEYLVVSEEVNRYNEQMNKKMNKR